MRIQIAFAELAEASEENVKELTYQLIGDVYGDVKRDDRHEYIQVNPADCKEAIIALKIIQKFTR